VYIAADWRLMRQISAGRLAPLVVVPTALSVDAFFTAASGVRQAGCVFYLPTRAADTVIRPDASSCAGMDPLRRNNGCPLYCYRGMDWQFAHQRHQIRLEWSSSWVYANAQSILDGVLDCAEAAGRGDVFGLKTLYDCLAMEVQLCNQIGHSRPEEGSEHYFAYCVENLVGHGWPHGDLVGPGIMIMSKLQGQPTAPIEAALKACHIPLDRIPESIIQQTLKGLSPYVRVHNLPYGIAHELDQYVP
jgi:glycerol-1-phosphate dehydrogenase [NAD(P)+]